MLEILSNASQSKNCLGADHALLLEHYKTPHYPFQGGSHRLPGLLWPLLPAKVIKAILFHFTQNSVSMFLFGTNEQRPSLSNNKNLLYSTGSYTICVYTLCVCVCVCVRARTRSVLSHSFMSNSLQPHEQ